MPTIIYTVIVKADANPQQTRQIVGWDRYDSENPPPPQTSDYASVQIQGMRDNAWPPLVTPSDISNLGLTPDGQIVPCPQPVYTPPLKDQAGSARQRVQQQAAMVVAMGETFGPKMRAYVQALQAIINGTDTTSTALPTAPADPTT